MRRAGAFARAATSACSPTAARRTASAARAFFHTEYRINHRLFTYAKPIVAFMDGITMGGGVGIALPCDDRVATENTKFAMPETGIGLFPDVGGGWYLSRLPGRMGQYLALTGHRLDGAECKALGLATHYLTSDTLDEAKRRIAAAPQDIAAILGDLAVDPPERDDPRASRRDRPVVRERHAGGYLCRARRRRW